MLEQTVTLTLPTSGVLLLRQWCICIPLSLVLLGSLFLGSTRLRFSLSTSGLRETLGVLLDGALEMGEYSFTTPEKTLLLTIDSTLTLLLPYIVNAINEKMMYIFAAVNVISIPIGKSTSISV